MADKTLGQAAFDAYTRALPYPYKGLPWEALRPQVRAAWEAAATAVLEACGGSGD